MMRAVSYIRMSSRDQDTSPDQQRKAIRKLAEDRAYTLLREYFDPNITGMEVASRPQLLQMLADAADGQFDVVLAWDLDRLGRLDLLDVGDILKPLRNAGVLLVTVAQGPIDLTTLAGRLTTAVTSEGKKQYVLDLTRNCARGRLEAVRSGWAQGLPPYGYDRLYVDAARKEVMRVVGSETARKQKDWRCTLVPSKDQEAVNTVRWIFHSFVREGRTLTGIVRELNERGVASYRGARWWVTTIKRIMSNPAYIGAKVFGRRRSGKYFQITQDGPQPLDAKSQPSATPAVMQMRAHEPLIDPETFRLANEKLATVGGQRRNRTSSYLLSHVLRCGHCGGPLWGGRSQSGSYYRCFHKTDGSRSCGHLTSVPALDRAVVGLVQEYLTREATVKKLRASLRKAVGRQTYAKKKRTQLQPRIGKLERQLNQGIQNLLLAKPEYVPAMQQQLDQWQEEKMRLEQQLMELGGRGALSPEELIERAIGKLSCLTEQLQDSNVELARAAIGQLVDGIDLYWKPNARGRHRLDRGQIRFSCVSDPSSNSWPLRC